MSESWLLQDNLVSKALSIEMWEKAPCGSLQPSLVWDMDLGQAIVSVITHWCDFTMVPLKTENELELCLYFLAFIFNISDDFWFPGRLLFMTWSRYLAFTFSNWHCKKKNHEQAYETGHNPL